MQPGSYFDRDAVLARLHQGGFGRAQELPGRVDEAGQLLLRLQPRPPTCDPWRIGYDDAFHTDDLYTDDFGSGTDVPGSVIIGGTLNSAINPNAASSQVARPAAVHLGVNNNNPAVRGGCDRTSPTACR